MHHYSSIIFFYTTLSSYRKDEVWLQLQNICKQAGVKWDIKKMALAHKTGLCGVGEASVMIAASSPHRRDALEVGIVLEMRSEIPKCG